MEYSDIYNDISRKTQGDIYIGVVGPVRTGKSTFIKRFMDLLVIPNIQNHYQRERAKDELPQSASGRTIMTTEPKFIPNEAVNITLDGDVQFRVRMVDCVGYLVDGALGYVEEDTPRMVMTPWFDYPIPFEEASEIGTRKVIADHSTIGLVVTTDGSITDIDREDYVLAEERVINELKELKKPFVIIVNSINPSDYEVSKLRSELEEKHNVPVIALNCATIRTEEIHGIMEKILYEFPINEMNFYWPKWLSVMDDEHWIKKEIMQTILSSVSNIKKLNEVKNIAEKFVGIEWIQNCWLDVIRLGEGKADYRIHLKEGLFFKILSEMTELNIEGEEQLVSIMKDYSRIKREYDKFEYALQQVNATGYGVVAPQMSEMSLEEPEIVKHGNRFGVKLRASAPSIHLIRADIETEIAPLVGTEKQSEELLNYLLKEFEDEPDKIWNSNIFGKSLHELVSEGLNNKLGRMPQDARFKIQETLQRIINEGSSGLICIIL